MIIEKFSQQVQRQPGRLAVVSGPDRLTYSQLAGRVRPIAREMTGKGQVAALLFEHGVDMVASVLAALTADQTYLPLDVKYPENRLSYMLTQSGAASILTDTGHEALARRLCEKLAAPLPVIVVDRLAARPDPEGDGPLPAGDKPAYILYTSGSTGQPKGVFQDQANVYYYTRNWIERFAITPADRMTFFSAFSHDGAVQDMLGALLGGATLYPVDVMNQVLMARLADWLNEEQITIWHSVPTLFRYFVGTLSKTDRGRFPHLRYILLGGEPLRMHDIQVSRQFFPQAILVNVYGQTESSVSSLWEIPPADPVHRVLLGRPLDRTRLILVNDQDEIIEDIGVGEIVVACDHLALGYWQDQEASERVFARDEQLGRLYYTGDLARLLADGNIEFLGRKDGQVKVRGFRVEPGEIESCLLKHPAVREAAVTAQPDPDGNSELCAYVVEKSPGPASDDEAFFSGLRRFLLAELPEYMVPSAFMRLDRLPLTPNGKVDKKRLPVIASARVKHKTAFVPPANPRQEIICRIWAELLGVERVGIHDHFFELGGNSFKALTFLAKIFHEAGIEIPLSQVFAAPTAAELDEFLEKDRGKRLFEAIAPVEDRECYDLSFNQKRLWLLHQLDQQGASFNLSARFELPFAVSETLVQKVLHTLAMRHESLRTGFCLVDEEAVQFVLKEVSIPVALEDISACGEEEKQVQRDRLFRQLAVGPFALDQPPLIRLLLVKLAKDRYDLMYSMHHIISDGWSLQLLRAEFSLYYQGFSENSSAVLKPLELAYRDFSVWQSRWLKNPQAIDAAHRFWKGKLGAMGGVLELPADFSARGNDASGAAYVTWLTEEQTGRLRRLAEEHRVSLFMVLFSLYLVLLQRFSEQEEIRCAVISSGRDQLALQDIIGFFVNSLFTCTRVDTRESFSDFLLRVNEEMIDIFKHQGYPVELVCQELNMGYPEVTVSFNMLNFQEERTRERIEPPAPFHAADALDARFSLEVYALEFKNGVSTHWTYLKKQFLPQTIAYMADEYIELVDFFSSRPFLLLDAFDQAEGPAFQKNQPALRPEVSDAVESL